MRTKYPHTKHFTWSPGLQNDDRVIEINKLEGRNIVVTEKLDGENTTMARDYIHARSCSDMAPHISRSWVQALHGSIKHDIPDGWRICGENVYAKHSIHYTREKGNALRSYFQVFGIWDGDLCLSWDETQQYVDVLGLVTVPVLSIRPYDLLLLEEIGRVVEKSKDCIEGYVARISDDFYSEEYKFVTAKYVRANHIQTTTEHWLEQPMVKNEVCYV